MIVVDSSVIIDFWHFHREPAATILSRPDICICGVTLAELMHGALNGEDCDHIREDLGKFARIPIREEDWAALGRNLFLLRKAGKKFPFQDVLLATLAMARDIEIWSNDGHFASMKDVFANLKLFDPKSIGSDGAGV